MFDPKIRDAAKAAAAPITGTEISQRNTFVASDLTASKEELKITDLANTIQVAQQIATDPAYLILEQASVEARVTETKMRRGFDKKYKDDSSVPDKLTQDELKAYNVADSAANQLLLSRYEYATNKSKELGLNENDAQAVPTSLSVFANDKLTKALETSVQTSAPAKQGAAR